MELCGFIMTSPIIKTFIDLSSGLEWNSATEQEVTQWVAQIGVRRGRQRLVNEFEAGTATVALFDDGSLPNIPTDYIQTGKIKIYATWTINSITQTYPIFYGFITSSESQFNQANDEISRLVFNCVDAFRLLNNAVITTVSGASAQLSGTRVNKILDQVGFPAAPRSIDAGQTTCQADPGTQRSSLEAIRTVEKTEAGGFFIDRSGNAKFIDRDSLYNKLYQADEYITPRFVDFNDVGVISLYSIIQYQNAVVKADDDVVYNDITVQRLGGVAQNKQDATSISNYFKRSASRTDVLMQTDAEASDLASSLLQTLKDAETRIDQVTVDVSDAPSKRLTLCFARELLDVVYARKVMPDGSILLVERAMIQGIQLNLTPDRKTITFFIAEPLLKGLILNDEVFGQLDYNYLGY